MYKQLVYIKWYVRLFVFTIILSLLYISASCTRKLMNFMIWFDTRSISMKHTTISKWQEFDIFVANPDNHFVIQILLNISVNPIDMKDSMKRRPITDILYLEYCKANYVRLSY